MASAVSRSRLLDLAKVQCQIFSTTFNPERLRLGNKVLRQRLKGQILEAYYPRKSATFADLARDLDKYGLATWNEEEEDRKEAIEVAKARGKGAPIKKRTADASKKNKGKKKK